MHGIGRVVGAVALTIAALAGSAEVASASVGDGSGLCNSGFACGYADLSYTGTVFGSAKTQFDWNTVGFGDTATSVSANGASCKYTRYWVDTSWLNVPQGTYFVMYSRQMTLENYRDPDLRNGAGRVGEGSSVDFTTPVNDDVEASSFTGCV